MSTPLHVKGYEISSSNAFHIEILESGKRWRIYNMDALSSARLMELKAHHSLKDVQAYSLYSKFTEIDRAYKHDAEDYFEEMRFLDNTKILEIF